MLCGDGLMGHVGESRWKQLGGYCGDPDKVRWKWWLQSVWNSAGGEKWSCSEPILEIAL